MSSAPEPVTEMTQEKGQEDRDEFKTKLSKYLTETWRQADLRETRGLRPTSPDGPPPVPDTVDLLSGAVGGPIVPYDVSSDEEVADLECQKMGRRMATVLVAVEAGERLLTEAPAENQEEMDVDPRVVDDAAPAGMLPVNIAPVRPEPGSLNIRQQEASIMVWMARVALSRLSPVEIEQLLQIGAIRGPPRFG